MKSLMAVIILSAFIAAGRAARMPDPADSAPHYATPNYLRALQHSNKGLAESAIFQVVKLKLFYPGIKCDELLSQLEQLSEKGATPAIRFKAFLAATFLRHPDLLERLPKANYKAQDAFFFMLSANLQNAYLEQYDH